MAIDRTRSAGVSIRIAKHGDTYRVWVDEVDLHSVFRAYQVEQVILDMDEATQVDLGWVRP